MALFQRPFVKKVILIAAIALGLYFAITFLVPLVIPFLIAFLLAAVMQPVIGFLEGRCRISHKPAYIATAIVFILGSGAIVIFLIQMLIGQIRDVLISYPFYQAKFMDGLCCCCERLDGWLSLSKGASYAYFSALMAGLSSTLSDTVLPKLTSGSVRIVQTFFNALVFLFVTGIATVLLAGKYHAMGRQLRTSRAGRFLSQCGHSLYHALGAYLRAQVVIIAINIVLLSIMFYLIHSPYAILTGTLVAFLDALPFVGSGLILIPWGLVLLFAGQPVEAAYVAVGYLIVSCVREILEPKLIGNRMGISTLASLVCMYVGLKLFGILGFLFGPVAFLIGKELYGAIWQELSQPEKM